VIGCAKALASAKAGKMSSEEGFAWRMARFYGAERAQWTRASRLNWLRARVLELQTITDAERAEHKTGCERCQQKRFCLTAMSYTSAQSDRRQQVEYLNILIASEERDERYAQAARIQGVVYKHHVDGFCSYWQNLRHRKFEAVGNNCEGCGQRGALQAHHLHYSSLGYEEIFDLQALCADCHLKAHRTTFLTAPP
jgi:5-methylcytosine-specific restriction endonuclease McrA